MNQNTMIILFAVLFAIILIMQIFAIIARVSKTKPTKTRYIHIPRNTNQVTDSTLLQPGENLKVTFNRERFANEDEFILSINRWLANPQLANISCNFDTSWRMGWTVNKLKLNSITFTYDVFDGYNQYQYALIQLEHYGLYAKDTEAVINIWKEKNPNAIIINCNGGRSQRSTNMWTPKGIGAMNLTQVYTLFKSKNE